MSDMSGHDSSRRKFIKKLAYVPPVILTLNAVPSYATTGSQRYNKDDKGSHYSGDNNYSSRRRGHRGWFHRLVTSIKR
jgi:hypothetical protein